MSVGGRNVGARVGRCRPLRDASAFAFHTGHDGLGCFVQASGHRSAALHMGSGQAKRGSATKPPAAHWNLNVSCASARLNCEIAGMGDALQLVVTAALFLGGHKALSKGQAAGRGQ
jgi:hypothetical protein